MLNIFNKLKVAGLFISCFALSNVSYAISSKNELIDELIAFSNSSSKTEYRAVLATTSDINKVDIDSFGLGWGAFSYQEWTNVSLLPSDYPLDTPPEPIYRCSDSNYPYMIRKATHDDVYHFVAVVNPSSISMSYLLIVTTPDREHRDIYVDQLCKNSGIMSISVADVIPKKIERLKEFDVFNISIRNDKSGMYANLTHLGSDLTKKFKVEAKKQMKTYRCSFFGKKVYTFGENGKHIMAFDLPKDNLFVILHGLDTERYKHYLTSACDA